jgi:hypothetical protein
MRTFKKVIVTHNYKSVIIPNEPKAIDWYLPVCVADVVTGEMEAS